MWAWKAVSSNFYFSHDLHNEAISLQLLSCFIFQFSLVTQSCLTVCNPMDRRMPGLPVHHQLLESTHTHVDWVSDAIQPFHSLSPPSLPTVKLSQHQGLFKWVNSPHQVTKGWSFSFKISLNNEHPGLISFRMDWLDLLAVQGTLKSLLQHHSSKAAILWCTAFFIAQLSHSYMTTGKTTALTRWTFVDEVMSLLFIFFNFYFILFFNFYFIYFFISWSLITLQYCSGFCHTLTWISHGYTCISHPNPPSHLLSTRSLWVFPVHQVWVLVSCIQPGLVICFNLDNTHVLMLFSQNIPPSPSPTGSKSLFYTSVSLFLFCI